MRLAVATTAATLACLVATPAMADPGMADEVYSATVEHGETELEMNWGRLTGGHGEDALKLEGAYGIDDRLRMAAVAEFAGGQGQPRQLDSVSAEAIYALGNAGGIDFALYGEYEFGRRSADKIEAKLLAQRRAGRWDLRLNLIAEKELDRGEPVEFEYAAATDVAAVGELRLGAEAFGELGSTRRFLPRAKHFVGPAARLEIDGLGPEVELRAGYLFPLGAAKDTSDGQLRVGLELEF